MCQIQWIDDKGNATPDDKPAIGRVRCKMYNYRPFQTTSGPARKPWAGEWSQWLDICADHAKQLDRPDMVDWAFEAFEAY